MQPEDWLNDRYRIDALLGEGGMGRVYRARDMRLERTVAIKFLPRLDSPSRVERFQREAMAVARLNHPNIVTIYDYDYAAPSDPAYLQLPLDGVVADPARDHTLPADGELHVPGAAQTGRPFIVMEYLPGRDIAADALGGSAAVLDALAALADALAYAHAEGIVHRDIKPANIRLTPDGRVKLLDFGIAALGDQPRITSPGELVGTWAYMSPEQARGEEVDARSDIYALALVGYELLAGTLPFNSDNPVLSLSERLDHEPQLLREHAPELPTTLEKMLADALSRDREQRPQDAILLARGFREARVSLGSGPQRAANRFGRYELTRLIAVGGMGEIYLARMRGAANFEKRCVIKKILPHLASEEEFVTKFIDEANTVVQLTHGNIVPVFDMGEENGEFYIAMEFIPGLDLRSVLKARRMREPMAPDVCVAIIAEVCKGLAYAHRKSNDAGEPLHIIHRDISPSNILISQEGEVKLVDFGIAKAAVRTTRSITGRLQGKFGYMSPEQARGQEVDLRTDIFSTGVVLYEMLTGKKSFEGRSDLDSLERVKTYAPVPPSALNPAVTTQLDAIVLKAIGKEPEERFQSADEMLEALMGYLIGVGVHVSPAHIARELGEELSAAGGETPGPGARFEDLLDLEANRMLARSGGPRGGTESIDLTGTATATPSMPSISRPAPIEHVSETVDPLALVVPAPSGNPPGASPTRVPIAPEAVPAPPLTVVASRRSRSLAVAVVLLAFAVLAAAYVVWRAGDETTLKVEAPSPLQRLDAPPVDASAVAEQAATDVDDGSSHDLTDHETGTPSAVPALTTFEVALQVTPSDALIGAPGWTVDTVGEWTVYGHPREGSGHIIISAHDRTCTLVITPGAAPIGELPPGPSPGASNDATPPAWLAASEGCVLDGPTDVEGGRPGLRVSLAPQAVPVTLEEPAPKDSSSRERRRARRDNGPVEFSINSKPPGATVFLGRDPICDKTPCKYALAREAKAVQIKVVQNRTLPWRGKLDPAGASTSVHVDFESYATITVRAIPLENIEAQGIWINDNPVSDGLKVESYRVPSGQKLHIVARNALHKLQGESWVGPFSARETVQTPIKIPLRKENP